MTIGRKSVRGHWMRCVAASALGIATVTAGMPASAQGVPTDYAISARPLADTLLEISRRANVDVTVPEALTRGRTAPAIDGRLSPREALERALGGSGLVLRQNGGASFLVERAAGNAAGAASPAARAGRGTITGSLKEETTGAALKGARIVIEETGEVVASDDLGQFRFVNVPAGRVTLRVSYLGYPATSMLVVVEPGATASAPITLTAAADAPEIIVTGQTSARAQALNQERTGKNSRTIISGDLLGQFNGTTISDAMRRAPGVAFEQDPMTGDGTNIILRGMTPNYNQITVNGVALPEGSGTGRAAGLNNLLADSVSEIRISKTLLASQDSTGTGGLVEITTKSPLDRPKRYFNFSADSTRRGKGFGEDYQFAATASARFGSTENFGLSASIQLRKQDVTNYAYSIGGMPGAYLPAAPDGTPIQWPSDLDPRTPFPFYEGAKYYTVSAAVSQNRIKAKTSNLSLAAAWNVSDSTDLRLDFTRSRRKADTLLQSYDIGPSAAGYSLQAVPAENGAPRYVYGDAFPYISATTRGDYIKDMENGTDTLSFQGNSKFGALSLKYRAGFAKGQFRQPYSALFFTGGGIERLPAYLAPGAIDPDTGTIVTDFGARSGRGIPIPNLTEAGLAALRNLPAPEFSSLIVSHGVEGRSTNWTGGLDAKWDFSNSILESIEAGLDYRSSRFSSDLAGRTYYSAEFDYQSYSYPSLEEFGVKFQNLPFGDFAGAGTVYKFITQQSLSAFLQKPDELLKGGRVTKTLEAANALLNSQFTMEVNVSAYVQANLKAGNVEVIPGLRIDRNQVTSAFANGVSIYNVSGARDEAFYNASLVIERGSDVLTSYLPRVLINYRPEANLIFRAGYYSTVARPQINQLTRANNIFYYAARRYGPARNQPSLSISRGNPGLKPARTHNFDVSGEWYFDNVGALKASLFHKRITNLLEATALSTQNALDGVVLPDHPVLNNLPADTYIELITPRNNPDVATIWGGEVSFERRLTFLPGALSGLGIYANYTYSDSRKTETFSWDEPTYGPAGVTYKSITYTRTGDFAGAPRHSGTIGLLYSKYGFDGSLYYTKRSRLAGSFAPFYLEGGPGAFDSLDFRGVYNFKAAGADARLVVEALDLLKSSADANTENVIGGYKGTPRYYTSGTYLGGRSFSLGLSVTF